MSDQPLISVIIPVRNRPRLLRECIYSVLSQDFPSWEAIIVDDGSEDETPAVIREFANKEPRIVPCATKCSARGVTAARALGFSASRAPYIMYVDSDDLLAPFSLGLRYEAIEKHPDVDGVVFQVESFRNTPGDNPGFSAIRRLLLEKVDPLEGFLAHLDPWYVASVLFRREVLSRFGGWSATVNLRVDSQFYIRCLVEGVRFYCEPIVDYFCRDHHGERVSNLNSLAGIDILKQVYRAIFSVLLEHSLLDARKRKLLAGAIFWDAVHMAKRRSVFALSSPDSSPLLTLLTELSLVPPSSMPLLRFALFLQRIPLLSLAGRECLRLPWLNYVKRRSIFQPAVLSYSFQRLLLRLGINLGVLSASSK